MSRSRTSRRRRDPTQLYGDRYTVTLDRQVAALNEVMADVRAERGIAPGQFLPVPVAVVIPKFDLLVTHNPIQGQSMPFIRQILREMNPPPKDTTPATVRDRGAVVEQILELMSRGCDVRGLFEGYFGSQVMFFPASSVSRLTAAPPALACSRVVSCLRASGGSVSGRTWPPRRPEPW